MTEKDLSKEHYKFFQHRECEFFPCHDIKDDSKFNCLFCYCPLFALGDRCGGNYKYLENGFKDCSGCLFPHIASNYEKIIERYGDIIEVAKQNRSE